MIRFVDIREADTGDRFAFFDTVTDRFIELCGYQTWPDWDDFDADWAAERSPHKVDLERCRALCPPWAFEPMREPPRVEYQQCPRCNEGPALLNGQRCPTCREISLLR